MWFKSTSRYFSTILVDQPFLSSTSVSREPTSEDHQVLMLLDQ